MRLKSLCLNVLHGMCIGAILFLAGFIVHKKWGDPVDAGLKHQMQNAMDVGFSEIVAGGQTAFENVEKNASNYPNSMTADYLERANTVKDKASKMLMLLDSVGRKPTTALLNFVQKELQAFRSEVSAMIDFGSPHTAVVTSKFEPAGWLLQSWENDSRQQFAAVLAKTKLDVGIIATALLLDFQRRTTVTCGIMFDRYCVGIHRSQISTIVGDMVTVDVSWSAFATRSLNGAIFRLNGQELPEKDGIAEFKVRHKKPGKYPLHFSMERRDRLTDSVRVFEKTYWLRVRE